MTWEDKLLCKVVCTLNTDEKRAQSFELYITGSFWTEAGARDFAFRRRVLGTTRKRRVNALNIVGMMVRFAPEAPAPDTDRRKILVQPMRLY